MENMYYISIQVMLSLLMVVYIQSVCLFFFQLKCNIYQDKTLFLILIILELMSGKCNSCLHIYK